MPNTIKFSDNPNEETAFVTTEDDTRTRAVVTTTVDGTVKFPDNPNSTKVSVTVDGVARKAVAVYNLNGGSGDSHNKGYYATQAALEEAVPTGEAGDYAVVGSTDTIWVWDEDTSAWVDSDQKGQVVSVNSKTGTVVLTAEDVGALPQYSTMPVASSSNSGLAVQYTGATNASYTHNYIYENVATTTPSSAVATQTAGSSLSDITVNVATLEQFFGWTTDNSIEIAYTENGWSVNPQSFGVTYTGTPVVGDKINTVYTAPVTTYAWTRVDVQPAPSGLPDQTGHSGEFLTTDGSDASWATVDALPSQTGYSGRVLGTDGFVAGWVEPEIVQRSTMPQASADELGNIYQFTGTTDANYTNGYFYKCVSDGGNPATYSWSQVDVMPAGSSLPSQTGNSEKFLTTDGTDASWSDKPTRSIRNGATGTASMVARPFSENYNYTVQYCTAFGLYANFSSSAVQGATVFGTGTNSNNTSAGYYSTAVGYRTSAGGANASTQAHAIAYGAFAKATANHSAQFGSTGSQTTNSDANTYKFANANGNFEIMSADGTVPTDRFTTSPVADGTYVPTLTIASGVATRSWAAPASGTSSISVTLPAADWSGSAQTVTATGVTASNTVIVGAAPASASEYNTCGVICTAQGADSLSFSCSTTPTNDLTVNVILL